MISLPFPSYGDVSQYFSGQINRGTSYLSNKLPGQSGPIGRWGGFAAKHPMATAGTGLAALFGAGNIALGDASVMGTAGYGITGGLIGAAGGAAWSMGANMLGGAAAPMGGSSLMSNTGTMAKRFGIRGAVAGALFGAALGGNSAPNRFSGF